MIKIKVNRVNTKNIKTDKLKLVPFGDLHLGSRECKLDEIKNQINWIKNQKNVLVIIMGDTINSSLRTSIGAGSFDDYITPSEQIDLAIELLTPISDKIIGMYNGNHSNRIYNSTTLNPEKTIATSIGVPYLGDSCFNHIRFGNQTYIIHGAHGATGSTTIGGALNACMKYSNFADADVYLMGHCFDEKTEVLTNHGWKHFHNLDQYDKVMTMNKKTEQLEYNNINNFTYYDNYDNWVRIKGRSVDLLTTDKHGLVGYNNGSLKEFTSKDFIDGKPSRTQFILAGQFNSKGITFSDNELRLITNIVADGSFSKYRLGWHLKKRRKIKHLKNLLNIMKIPYTISILKDETVHIRIKNNFIEKYINLLNSKKILPRDFINCSKLQFDIVLDEYSKTDGSISSENAIQVSSNNKDNIDILQTMCAINNKRSNMTISKRSQFILSINNRNTLYLTNKQSYKTKHNGYAWCLSVNNGTLMVRRNGKVCITQNSHRLASHTQVYYRVNLKDKTMEKKKRYFVLTGSYLEWKGSYAESKAYEPQKTGSPVITLNKDNWDIHVSV